MHRSLGIQDERDPVAAHRHCPPGGVHGHTPAHLAVVVSSSAEVLPAPPARRQRQYGFSFVTYTRLPST